MSKTLFKQFALTGIGITPMNGPSKTSRHTEASDRHPYLKQEFWNNCTNQFWNSDLYSEESKRDLAMRAKVKQIDKLLRELQQMDVDMILKDEK